MKIKFINDTIVWLKVVSWRIETKCEIKQIQEKEFALRTKAIKSLQLMTTRPVTQTDTSQFGFHKKCKIYSLNVRWLNRVSYDTLLHHVHFT